MDAVAALILSESTLFGPVAVLDDRDGVLTQSVLDAGHDVQAWCDDIRDERALPAGTAAQTPDEALTGARTVLWRLPRSVDAVTDLAERIASASDPAVRVVAGGRDKDMTRAMNGALAKRFADVSASLGVRKARALRASVPLPGEHTWPRTRRADALGIDIVARGATFATNRVDAGTALLLAQFRNLPSPHGLLPRPGRAIDVGSGSGILATLLARLGWDVTATDVAASACESTRLAAAANGVEVSVVRGVGLEGAPEDVDLVVCNPPFHRGASKDSGPTRDLFREARIRLNPGGELWVVFNSHLPYLSWLNSEVGPTSIVARDRNYTVTRTCVPSNGEQTAEATPLG